MIVSHGCNLDLKGSLVSANGTEQNCQQEQEILTVSKNRLDEGSFNNINVASN